MSGLAEACGDECKFGEKRDVLKVGEITEAAEEDKVLLLLFGLSGVTKLKCVSIGGGQDCG
jgi:hypothetical protein